MPDEEYEAGLRQMVLDWGGLAQDPDRPGCLRALNDPTAGMIVGFRARLVGEIINRAIKEAAK